MKIIAGKELRSGLFSALGFAEDTKNICLKSEKPRCAKLQVVHPLRHTSGKMHTDPLLALSSIPPRGPKPELHFLSIQYRGANWKDFSSIKLRT